MPSDRNLPERCVEALAGPLRPLAFRALKLLGVEFPAGVVRGQRLRLAHGAVGLVVHPAVEFGDDVKLYQGVTLGRSDVHLPSSVSKPGGGIIIGDRVVIGAGAVVLFRSGHILKVGDDAVIGANAVVLADVPAGEAWAGNPARRVSASAVA